MCWFPYTDPTFKHNPDVFDCVEFRNCYKLVCFLYSINSFDGFRASILLGHTILSKMQSDHGLRLC